MRPQSCAGLLRRLPHCRARAGGPGFRGGDLWRNCLDVYHRVWVSSRPPWPGGCSAAVDADDGAARGPLAFAQGPFRGRIGQILHCDVSTTGLARGLGRLRRSARARHDPDPTQRLAGAGSLSSDALVWRREAVRSRRLQSLLRFCLGEGILLSVFRRRRRRRYREEPFHVGMMRRRRMRRGRIEEDAQAGGSRWRCGNCSSFSLCSGAHGFGRGTRWRQQGWCCGVRCFRNLCNNTHLGGDCGGAPAPNATRRCWRSGCCTGVRLCANVNPVGDVGTDGHWRRADRCFGCSLGSSLCVSTDPLTQTDVSNGDVVDAGAMRCRFIVDNKVGGSNARRPQGEADGGCDGG